MRRLPVRSRQGARMSEKIALVTGGNRGLGFETARKLAMRGFDGALEWFPTDYRGVDVDCAIGRIIELVAQYDDAWGRI